MNLEKAKASFIQENIFHSEESFIEMESVIGY